jgi:putative aldouronate transport system permease protein
MAKQKPVLEGVEKFNRIGPVTNMMFNLLFIALSLAAVLPVLFVLIISLSDEMAIQNFGYRMLPAQFSTAGYEYLAEQSGMILRTLGNSIVVTVIGTILGVLLTTLMGYVLSRSEYRLQKFFSWVVFIPMIFNGGLVSQYVVNTQMLFLKNTVWALILPMCVTSFNVIVAKTFFRITIPDSLIESAKIDGASRFQQARYITLPLLKTVIILMFIIAVGKIFYSDFGLFYQVPRNSNSIYNQVYVIDVYIYRLLQTSTTGMASAAALIQSVVGCVTILLANGLVRKVDPESAMM